MSRITGFLSFSDVRHARQRCGQMGKIFVTTGWNLTSESIGSAALAWCGSKQSNLARVGNVIATVDGHFINLEEFKAAGAGPDASSSEWLIVLYQAYGFERALERLAGEFAVALYDSTSGQLWLARDRVGHRPLYYAETPSGIAFASRIGSLLVIPEVPVEPNRRFVSVFAGSHYRYIDNVPDESPYAAIHQVPAATVVCFTDGAKRTSRYWQLTEQPEFLESEQELAVQYRELLMEAVRQRLALCTKPAFTLSGGMDSSSVLSCAVEAVGSKLHAFSSVYTDKTYDESDEIKTFLSHKVEKWHPILIEGFDLFSTVRKMVAVHDEPVATATWLSHFLLCEAVRQAGFDALFGGLGGDELNAGEYEYFPLHFADLKCNGNQAQLEHEITAWAHYHDHPIYRKNREAADRLVARLTDSSFPGRVRAEQERLTRYYCAVSKDYFDLSTFLPILDHPFKSYLKNRMYQDIFRETAPCCLRAEDRDCSSFGLAHMDPFFDHRLIEFMFRVPGHMKIRDGITKRLLREAMKGVLPEETRTRIKKTGWNAPAHIWFSRTALTELQDLVESKQFRERGVYDVKKVRQLLTEHLEIIESGAPRENHMMFFWQLVNLELWLQYVDGIRDRNAVRISSE
jgi:asparagine synthase (glutamine-hydrolysing)